eukprot:CAMPEP_0201692860 /NCGR_PEP_ID=MMETSP0578-20130828/5640_1 /ASSEMBLY_ACC=CAM_ASM_000663 /TAXON_ID=267565 /ORGANISM="Skeletonema grethea, Strain CCMP 1804" /LENGTH=59 /DNA_ID=CAMNT_0048178305 /DNA_START=119 /DNA_END=295 /DNA_ORIENTATION=+
MALSAAHGASAFTTAPSRTVYHRPLFATDEGSSVDTVAADTEVAVEESKLIMDIPPTPV